MKIKTKKTPSLKERISAELSRIESELRTNQKKTKIWCQLYAAQQALTWALTPNGFASPSKAILRGDCRQ